ncbi:MAG: hypothetical protein JRH15_08495 [Deltaproteobacteria bacterium]|nr:hypothetical protein [Deltaproteobacteria bacterium]
MFNITTLIFFGNPAVIDLRKRFLGMQFCFSPEEFEGAIEQIHQLI